MQYMQRLGKNFLTIVPLKLTLRKQCTSRRDTEDKIKTSAEVREQRTASGDKEIMKKYEICTINSIPEYTIPILKNFLYGES